MVSSKTTKESKNHRSKARSQTRRLTVTASSCRATRSQLPDWLINEFGKLGFLKWTSGYTPVLIVDPMQMVLRGILPEGIYHAWLHKMQLHTSFVQAADYSDREDDNNCDVDSGQREKEHNYMTAATTQASIATIESIGSTDGINVDMTTPVLVYWYGTNYEFSIVRLSSVVPWEDGCRRGYGNLPSFIAERMNNKKRRAERVVPSLFHLIQDGLRQLEEHDILSLAPGERSLAIFPDHINDSNGNGRKGKYDLNNVVLNQWHALALEEPPNFRKWQLAKTTISQKLPHSNLFGKLAFLPRTIGRKQKMRYHHPVLVLSPFRVPPDRRKDWFKKCGSGKFVMVYWLGFYTVGKSQKSMYTCHKPESLILYDEGVLVGYDKIPPSILEEYRKSSLSQMRLWMIEPWVCGVQWELPQALKRNPDDRWGGLEDFEESMDDDFEYYWKQLNTTKESKNEGAVGIAFQKNVDAEVDRECDNKTNSIKQKNSSDTNTPQKPNEFFQSSYVDSSSSSGKISKASSSLSSNVMDAPTTLILTEQLEAEAEKAASKLKKRKAEGTFMSPPRKEIAPSNRIMSLKHEKETKEGRVKSFIQNLREDKS